MSNRWLAGWLEADIRLRMFSVIGVGALMALLMWQFWLYPAGQKSHQLDKQADESVSRYQQRIAVLRRLPPLSTLEKQIEQLGEQAAVEDNHHFSLPALLAACGGELEHWQPNERGGELSISLRWQQFTDLLGYLMTLRPAVTIPLMTLQGKSPRLHLLIQLHYEI